MFQFWNNLSVSKKLCTVFGVLALLITTELVTLKFAMDTLSSVRSFVGGEGMWSKAQKSSIQSLQKYALTGQDAYLDEYEDYIKILLGDREARFELEKPNPNIELIYHGFQSGGIHKNDIPGLIRLIRNLNDASYIKKVMDLWEQGDSKVDELIHVAQTLKEEVKNKNKVSISAVLDKIYQIDKDLTQIENEFSLTLGQGSRWLERLLMITLLVVVFTVEGMSLFLTFLFSKNLSQSLKEMNTATREIGMGNFDQTLQVRSSDELGQLASSINKMTNDLKKSIGERNQAESANKIKTIFLANMSHEIRTPLGVILGLNEILKNDNLSLRERHDYLEVISRTGRNLLQILNDIIDISKVESGYLSIEKNIFKLHDFLNDLSKMISAQAEGKNIKINFTAQGDVPNEIVTDKNRLWQILVNLLNNALKFTNKGLVELTYWSDASHLYFKIIDNGIGMSEDQKRNLFTIFYQGDATSSRKYEGTGLGLALSKRLAKSLGGDLTLLDSQISKGSAFVVTIPLEIKSLPKLIPKDEVEKAENLLTGKKILVVEDNKDNQLLVKLFLEKVGANIDFANNGEEGVKQALSKDYDVIIMDIQMPILDGYGATKLLRTKGYDKPIIALTAHAMTEEKSESIKAGCNDYITKPVSSRVLYNALLKSLNLPPKV